MASALQWIPQSLYSSSLSSLVRIYTLCQKEIRGLPENIQFDVYYKLYEEGRLCQLGIELSDLIVFDRVLKVNDKRHLLHHCFQAVMDHAHNMNIANILAYSYTLYCNELKNNEKKKSRQHAAILGLQLGGFLSDAGWFLESEKVLIACLNLCSQVDEVYFNAKALECCLQLLHAQNAYCKFTEANKTYEDANIFVKKLQDKGQKPNLAGLYAEFSSLFFVKSYYDDAYRWSIKAIKEISPTLPLKCVIDVLRQASKACVVKRDFKRAEMLVKQAVHLAREHFGFQHPKYSDALLDYGFYLLNIDLVGPSVQVYQTALDVRLAVFGGNNLNVGVAHEDLAYASYVNEYTSGKFSDARCHAEKAMEIMTHIVREEHLLLASSKRVKALILEEIAIDNHDKSMCERLLADAQKLHLSALRLAQKAFGEINVQTAKHYGNLGRLYQSMRRFQEAEEMHKKAILIKEKLLGDDDYEVALSLGHLASLYNYDIGNFKDAEKLYLRSIEIAKKLFGDGYSGLEYDYRGLLRVHKMLGNHSHVAEYTRVLHEWKQIRDHNAQCEVPPLQIHCQPRPTEDVIQEFFQNSLPFHIWSCQTCVEKPI
uniref:Uncharacterized protein n=1 Tax=Strigamia maritima TaxID=126957 RepID=T1JC70_STRMM